ncbi:MAG: SDR family oxidoreductase [Planctomycetaceae bacterium]
MMYTLLTGATGLVGRYLVRDLLLNGHKLAVVVRPSKKQTPAERMEIILQHWEDELGSRLPRPVVLAGDISDPGFGFSEEDRDWVRDHVDTIIHSAAILEFYGEDRSGEPWRTNLGGTQNMIELCRELDIRDIHYVSTAYVAGTQTTVAMEDALDVGQEFRNDYEHSKFLAEKAVREIDFADHVTVYRPAVIAGDSVTGYTNTYHGIYLYLRLAALMVPAVPPDENGVRHTPIRFWMTGEERRNVIPVEWVSAVMVRLFETPEARGGTYQMAPDVPLTSGEVIRYTGDYYNSTGAVLCGPPVEGVSQVARDEDEDQWLFERLYSENMGTYQPYETSDNVFDMTNTKRFAGDIICPRIDRTVIYRYIDYGTQDRWGKNRPQYDAPAAWACDVLAGVPAADDSQPDAVEVGVDAFGPGGGQFSLLLSDSGVSGIRRGLPDTESPVFHVPVELLVQAASGADCDAGELTSAWDGVSASQASKLTSLLVQALSATVPARPHSPPAVTASQATIAASQSLVAAAAAGCEH